MQRLRNPLFGLDYAWARLSAAQHHAAGSHFAVRYLSHDTSKDASRAEVDGLIKGGIPVALVWETSARRAWEGRAAGQQDAHDAANLAHALGQPTGRPIYFAADDDPAGNPGATDAYYDGAGSVLGKGRVGAYGGIELITHHFNRGYHWGWQTRAWSGTSLDVRAQLYQYLIPMRVSGQDCDGNHAFYADYGQWPLPAVAPNPHYNRFYAGTVHIGSWRIDERRTVMLWDKVWPHRHEHPKSYMDHLWLELLVLRKYIWLAARGHVKAHPPGWGYDWRWWRYQELAKRSGAWRGRTR